MEILDITYSLYIQIANFLILLFVLNKVLYRPIRHIIAKRRGEMETFEKTISDFQEKSTLNEHELEQNRAGAVKDGFQEKEDLRNEGLEEEKGLVQDAIFSTTEKIVLAKQDIGHQMASVRQSLENQAAEFSRELAEKILGRPLDA
ncbi:MAG: ATP synthase F0 subunit B [Deltaproteobacteria bacterium]|nr:ATP synthase F0 subunit B [Deltaproteobacteria bacterium]